MRIFLACADVQNLATQISSASEALIVGKRTEFERIWYALEVVP